MQNMIFWALLIVAVGVFWYMRRPTVRSDEARRLVAEGALLVDVRSMGEFAAGHIDGARNIPVGEIGSRLNDFGSHDRPIVLYCASGMRSASAASTLKRAGFQQVFNLGSMNNW
jgi:rhodanese-related sulfurtransferase